MTDKKLNARQLEALEALVVKGRLCYARDRSGRWQYVSNMGGAVARMGRDLVALGYISTRLDDGELRRKLQEFGGQATAKALRALVAEAERRGDGQAAADFEKLLIARVDKELTIGLQVEAKEAADRKAAAERARADRLRHVACLQAVLDKHGLGDFAAKLTDDELIAFARDVEGAEYEGR